MFTWSIPVNSSLSENSGESSSDVTTMSGKDHDRTSPIGSLLPRSRPAYGRRSFVHRCTQHRPPCYAASSQGSRGHSPDFLRHHPPLSPLRPRPQTSPRSPLVSSKHRTIQQHGQLIKGRDLVLNQELVLSKLLWSSNLNLWLPSK